MVDLDRRGYSVAAMRDAARRVLPRPIFDFIEGGAENEATLARNEGAFGRLELLPRPLNGVGDRDLSLTLFGRRLSLPVVVAPTGISGLVWPDGEFCAARAATAAGTAFCLSHASTCTIEQLAATGVAPRWMQTFIYRDRGITREFAARAAAGGYDALVVTIDNQVVGNRERDIRNGFRHPPRLGPAEIAAWAARPGWLWRMRGRLTRINLANYVKPGAPADVGEMASYVASQLDPTMSWKDIDAVRQVWRGPLIIKGIVHPEEAAAAIDHGVDGIVVSNHGGRQLDGGPATIDALPGVVEAVGGRIPVLLDGGVRRGADVVRALALGARACLIGRPQVYGLAVAGEAGVAHVLELFRSEIDRVMALCGVENLSAIGPDLLFHGPRRV